MICIIVWYVIYCLLSLFIAYCCDDGWHIHDDLTMPSVYDLDDPKRYDIDRYVREVICPASNYFELKSELLSKKDETTSLYGMVSLFAISMIISYSINDYLKSIHIYEWPSFWWGTAISVILLLLCILTTLGIYLLYDKKLSVKKFWATRERLYDEFKQQLKHSGICNHLSEEKAFNNYLIRNYHTYLLNIKPAVENRYTASKFILLVAVIAFLIIVRISNA